MHPLGESAAIASGTQSSKSEQKCKRQIDCAPKGIDEIVESDHEQRLWLQRTIGFYHKSTDDQAKSDESVPFQ